MNTKTKKKLCWNCEGNVSLSDETCPYCGVSLEVSPMIGTALGPDPLNPPYKYAKSNADDAIPQAPYRTDDREGEEDLEAQQEPQSGTVSPGKDRQELQNTVIALSALLLGFTLLLFSVILLLFSDDNGYLTLRWSASYWYLYLVFGAPLLYWGWNTASSLDLDRDVS